MENLHLPSRICFSPCYLIYARKDIKLEKDLSLKFGY